MNHVVKLDLELSSKDPNEGYDTITNNFLKVVNKHASLKKKTISGNDPLHKQRISKSCNLELH